MPREFKSFYKTVGGNEGSKCHYPTRLDTYGCGCKHDCLYCYGKSLLEFRNLWHPDDPSVADVKKIKRKIAKLDPEATPALRLGGMTDCFQPLEQEYGVTYETIKALNEQGLEYLIVTKSPLVSSDKYMDILDKTLAHIQVSVTSTDGETSRTFENAPDPRLRIQAIEKLYQNGFDVALRLSPYIPQYIDIDTINAVKCEKLLIEFLRVNTWIKRAFDIDYTPYTVKQGNYRHLPLDAKIDLIQPFLKGHTVTICEDVSEHYDYWKENVNPNPNDCCNLRVA